MESRHVHAARVRWENVPADERREVGYRMAVARWGECPPLGTEKKRVGTKPCANCGEQIPGKPENVYCGRRAECRRIRDRLRAREFYRKRRESGLTSHGKPAAADRDQQCEQCGIGFRATSRRRQCEACRLCPCGQARAKGKPNCQPCLTAQVEVARTLARPSATCRVFYGDCIICGVAFASQHTRVTCSSACQAERKRDRASNKNHRRRVLERDAYVAPVVRLRIHERDKWRCHLCRKLVSKTAVVPHPRAATLDHLVPLAAGGTHEPANVATACFMCNCLKGDRGGGEQLMLLG